MGKFKSSFMRQDALIENVIEYMRKMYLDVHFLTGSNSS